MLGGLLGIEMSWMYHNVYDRVNKGTWNAMALHVSKSFGMHPLRQFERPASTISKTVMSAASMTAYPVGCSCSDCLSLICILVNS